MGLKKTKVKNVNISSDTNNLEERKNSVKRIINEDTSFQIIEAYKSARTNVMFSLNNEKGCKKVVVTSATSGEGKTTSCINLACTFAETGARVLVVDADLRAPRLHRYLSLSNDKGLSNILAGFDEAKNCIVSTGRENLDAITSGPIPPNPVELVSGDSMKELLDSLGTMYDYIFLDTPPVNIVTEAVIMSKYSTGVILVTRQKYTMYKMIEKAVNSLKFANAKIIGFIMNDVDESTYAYSGGNYRYSSKKNRYVRYGYYGVDSRKAASDTKEKADSAKK